MNEQPRMLSGAGVVRSDYVSYGDPLQAGEVPPDNDIDRINGERRHERLDARRVELERKRNYHAGQLKYAERELRKLARREAR